MKFLLTLVLLALFNIAYSATTFQCIKSSTTCPLSSCPSSPTKIALKSAAIGSDLFTFLGPKTQTGSVISCTNLPNGDPKYSYQQKGSSTWFDAATLPAFSSGRLPKSFFITKASTTSGGMCAVQISSAMNAADRAEMMAYLFQAIRFDFIAQDNSGACKVAFAIDSACSSASHCSGGSQCSTYGCSSSECVSVPKAPGPSGTCTGANVCNGQGACVTKQCTGSSDCGSSDSCKSFQCNSGICATIPAVAGTTCTSGGSACDGAGNCVDCWPQSGTCPGLTCAPIIYASSNWTAANIDIFRTRLPSPYKCESSLFKYSTDRTTFNSIPSMSTIYSDDENVDPQICHIKSRAYRVPSNWNAVQIGYKVGTGAQAQYCWITYALGGDVCPAGFGDCTAAAGCETPIDTSSNCGACGLDCSTLVGSNSVSQASCSVQNKIDFESGYSDGNVNGQNGWKKTGAQDVVVASTGGSITLPASFGTKALRLSDAFTTQGFGDQAFAAPMADSAGEPRSTVAGFSEGIRVNHFEAQFDIMSTMTTEQSGMHVSISPDRGDGSRMSYLLVEDVAAGLQVSFVDVPSPTVSFPSQVIATLTRTEPHTLKFVMDFVTGADNDVVKIYVDGVLKVTGKSWENYFDSEMSGEPTPRIVKTLLFRESNTANPGNSGNGYLIDNIIMTLASQAGCLLKCDTGKYNCNGLTTDGCESSSAC